jgi:tRNA(Ser,Leu) C12 N-acetylase TAN1
LDNQGDRAGPARRADWNVVVTLSERTFREACRLLGHWGMVRRTRYYNVLAMTVGDPEKFLTDFTAAVKQTPGLLNYVSHLAPAQRSSEFNGVEDFEAKAREIVLAWAPRLSGKSFHIRLHCRGFKSTTSTQEEERLLSETVLAALGDSAHVRFRDPDAVIEIETINGRAGLSFWTREDLRQYPFVRKL